MATTFDPLAAVREILVNSSTAHAITGDRIFAGPRTPDGYDPATDGEAVHFFIRGGAVDKYLPIVAPSMQFKFYGETADDAMQAYVACRSVLHGMAPATTTYGNIRSAFEESFGQTLVDPDTGWPFVLSFFEFKF